jgi:hypothetical protein
MVAPLFPPAGSVVLLIFAGQDAQRNADLVGKLSTDRTEACQAEPSETPTAVPASRPVHRLVLKSVTAYASALLIARTGVAVTHRTLGPNSSATTTTRPPSKTQMSAGHWLGNTWQVTPSLR